MFNSSPYLISSEVIQIFTLEFSDIIRATFYNCDLVSRGHYLFTLAIEMQPGNINSASK